MESYRVRVNSTKFGPIDASVRDVDNGYVAFVSATEYPDLPVWQASGDEPLARSVEEAVEQLRRAIDR